MGKSGEALYHALDAIDAIESAETLGELEAVFLRWAGRYGIDHVTLGRFPDPNLSQDGSQYITTWPEAWLERYIIGEHSYNDPLIAAIFASADPFAWDDIRAARRLTSAERQIFDEATEFGLNDGFVVPIYELNRPPAYVSLAGSRPEIDGRDRKVLHLVSTYLFSRADRLTSTTPVHVGAAWPVLTARERECLTWVASGKTDWEISQILSISERTATFHVTNAMCKLGVATRAQAVVEALRQNEIIL